jgi:hypothetical protein
MEEMTPFDDYLQEVLWEDEDFVRIVDEIHHDKERSRAAKKRHQGNAYATKQKKHLQKCLQEGKEVDLIQCVYEPEGGKIGCSSKKWRVATKVKVGNNLRFRLSCSECGIVSGSPSLAHYQHMEWKSRGRLLTAEQIDIAFGEMSKQSTMEEVIIELRKEGFNDT